MVEDLLRGFAPATVARALDFATLEQLSADYADDDLARSRAARMWAAAVRVAGEGALHVVIGPAYAGGVFGAVRSSRACRSATAALSA